jgi:hypothetical protein
MKLPHGESATIPIEKLIGYCLNPNHPSGKNKARVFVSILGITAENAEDLRELIVQAAIAGDVVQQEQTKFGVLYKVNWQIPGREHLTLRTLWQITADSPNPRLISAFLK